MKPIVEQPLRDTRTLVVQLRDRISKLISDEGLQPGDKLPTEAQLTNRFKISRPALREALKLLEQDDAIYVEHGRGRFVSAMAAAQVDRPITVFESVTDMTHQYGYNTTNKVLSVSEESPDQNITEKLKLSPDEMVIRLERLRFEGDEPIMYCVDYVPRSAIDADLGELNWRGSLIALLAQYQHRPRISAASVTAVMLPDEIVRRHGLEDFGPALLITETCFDAAGLPVIFAVDYHRGSHFSFSLVRK